GPGSEVRVSLVFDPSGPPELAAAGPDSLSAEVPTDGLVMEPGFQLTTVGDGGEGRPITVRLVQHTAQGSKTTDYPVKIIAEPIARKSPISLDFLFHGNNDNVDLTGYFVLS